MLSFFTTKFSFKLSNLNSFHAACLALASHSVCCILPLVLVALGSTGLLAGLNLGKYHTLFSIIGIASLAMGFYLYWKESAKPCGCCACSKQKALNQRRQSFAILMVAVVLQGSIWVMMANQSAASAEDVTNLGRMLNKTNAVANAEVYYDLKGVHCLGCAMEAEALVKHLPGVASADLNFSKSLLGIRFDSNQITDVKIEDSLRELGISYLKNTLKATDSTELSPRLVQ